MNAGLAAAKPGYQGMEDSSSPHVLLLTGLAEGLSPAAASAAGAGNSHQLLSFIKHTHKH